MVGHVPMLGDLTLEATPVLGIGERAAFHLRHLQTTIATLFPEVHLVTPSGRERERLHLLVRATTHVQSLPRTSARGGTEGTFHKQSLALRHLAHETLVILAEHAGREEVEGITRALVHWDQAGNLELLPEASKQAALRLHMPVVSALHEVLAQTRRTPALLGLLLSAAEAASAVDSACALLRAIEVRFVPLLRERLRREPGLSGSVAEREVLLPMGRSFLGLGEALSLLAQSFAEGLHVQ